MPNWAMFWILILAVSALLEAWVIFLLAGQVQEERAGRLEWKRLYFHPESHDLGSGHD